MPLPLRGLRILLVEDDPLIALDLAQVVAAAGADVLGPAHTVAKALSLIDSAPIDCAVLDWRLEKETVLAVAERLSSAGLPFLFHTSSRGNPERHYPKATILDKPSRPEQLVAAIRLLMESSPEF